MIWQLYKQEVKRYLVGDKATTLLPMIGLLIFIEIVLGSMTLEYFSLNMGNALFTYLIIGQTFSDFHARKSGQSDMMEYYLAKPISRGELFWAKLLSVSTICLLLISIVITANIFNPDTQTVKFRIYGYENSESISKIESFSAVYNNNSDKKFREYLHTEIKTLHEQGDYQQAKEKGKSYSETFINDDGLFYVLFLKCFLLVWSAIAAILYINYGDAKSTGELQMKYLKTPLGYLKLSGWLLIFSFMFIPLIISDSTLITSASYLTFYLIHFEMIVACSLLLLTGLVLTLRKNYLNISI
jgi:hypothetical protein